MALAKSSETSKDPSPVDLDTIVLKRKEILTQYQDKAYAQRYVDLVSKVQSRENTLTPGRKGLCEAVAHSYFKVLAYKDEYEVARLFSQTRFIDGMRAQFEGEYKLEFNLAPSWLAWVNRKSGQIEKRKFGPWLLHIFREFARLFFSSYCNKC